MGHERELEFKQCVSGENGGGFLGIWGKFHMKKKDSKREKIHMYCFRK